jgi:Flp pilus assembly pilin Flp
MAATMRDTTAGATSGDAKPPVASRDRHVRRLLDDERGAVMTEYLVITGFVGLVSIPAFAYLGYVVAHSYAFMQGYALLMFP